MAAKKSFATVSDPNTAFLEAIEQKDNARALAIVEKFSSEQRRAAFDWFFGNPDARYYLFLPLEQYECCFPEFLLKQNRLDILKDLIASDDDCFSPCNTDFMKRMYGCHSQSIWAICESFPSLAREFQDIHSFETWFVESDIYGSGRAGAHSAYSTWLPRHEVDGM